MARKPQRMPRWAYDAGVGALIEPPSGEQESGWSVNQKPPAPYLNWMFHHYSAWCDYLRGPSFARWDSVALAYSTSVLTFGALSVDDSSTESTTLVTRNVIAAIDGGGNCVFTSERGQVWTRRVNFTATGTFYRARYLGGRHWICVDHATAGVLLTVTGGSAVLSGTGSWTASTLPASTEGVRGIAYDDTMGWYAAITRTKPLASSGPASWADATLGSVPTGTFLDIAWSGTAFLAVTDDGEVFKASGGSAAAGSWTALAPLAATGAWRLSEGPDGQIVAWRENTGSTLSFYVTSNDGTNWTEVVSSPSVERVRSLHYADSVWVATTTEAPYVWQSNDLTNWSRLKLPYNGSTATFDAAYSEGSWIAVRGAEALVSHRAEDIAPGTWAADPTATATALSDAAYLRGRTISTTAPTDGQVYVWVASTSKWTPQDLISGDTESDTPQLSSSTGWTITDLLLGTGAIAGGAFTATIPVGTTSGTGSYATRTWPFADGVSWEIQGRVEITNDTNGEILAGLAVVWASGNYTVYLRGNGGLYFYRDGTAPWSFASQTISGSGLPVDGTLWLRMRGEGTALRVWRGIGSGSTPPTAWTLAANVTDSIFVGLPAAPTSLRVIGLSNNTHSVPSGTTCIWRNLTVRSFAP